MTYNDMPVIIPLLATGYLLTIYLLLILAQRTIKSSRYVANSLTDAYASYIPTDPALQTDEVERWSRSLQRFPEGRWANAEPNSSVVLRTAKRDKLDPQRLTQNVREPLPFGNPYRSGTPTENGEQGRGNKAELTTPNFEETAPSFWPTDS